LTLCTPYSTIEPIRQKLTTGFQSNRLEIDTHVIRRMESNIKKTDVNLSIELAKGRLPTRTILDLKQGDILQLETSPTDEAIVRVEGRPKYRGFVGTYRGSRAVRVTRAVMDQDDGSK
jgi:flagellar motor switch protein FliM